MLLLLHNACAAAERTKQTCDPMCRQHACSSMPVSGLRQGFMCHGCVPSKGSCHPAAGDYPRPATVACGVLVHNQVKDKDSLCLHLMHLSSRLGELRLLNSTVAGTISTKLPTTIAPQTDAWWAVQDSVRWSATGDGKGRVGLRPYSFSAWYGSANPGAGVYYEVEIRLSLNAFGEGSMAGEHAVDIRVVSSAQASHAEVPRYQASWTRCMLEANVVILDDHLMDDPPSPLQARGLVRATRAVHADDDALSSFCVGEVADYVTRASGQSGTRKADLSGTPSACELMVRAKAVNTVHVKYFLAQQEAERVMLDGAERGLCGADGVLGGHSALPDEDTYQQRLHALLKPYREATRLHIYLAFVAKSVCSRNAAVDRQRAVEQQQMLQLPSYAEGVFNLKRAPGSMLFADTPGWAASAARSIFDRAGNDEGRDSWLHLLSPYTHTSEDAASTVEGPVEGQPAWHRPKVEAVSPEFLPDQPDADQDWCPLPILHHEPFNTWESWFFWNVTSHLLKAGHSFCRAPAAERKALFASWKSRLEEVCHAHQHNNAFIVYWSAYEAPCRRLQVNAERKASLGQRVASWISDKFLWSREKWHEAMIIAEVEMLHHSGGCALSNVTAADLISAFGNDTQLTLSMGKALLRHGMLGAGDFRESSPCAALPETRKVALYNEIGRLPADERLGRRAGFMTLWGTWVLTLGSAYHKIVPICQAADTIYAQVAPPVWDCDQQPLPTEADGKIVYDLIPIDGQRGYCIGPMCAKAVQAIDAYRAFLHNFSHFRTAVVHAMLSHQCPFGVSGESRFLRELKWLSDRLPEVLAGFRAALPGLAATCVAPSRTFKPAMRDNWDFTQNEIASRNRRDARWKELGSPRAWTDPWDL